MSKYHKGDKFIVEIKEVMESDNGTLYRSDFKTLTFDDNGLDKLQKCETELSWDECYNKGLNDGYELGKKLWVAEIKGGLNTRIVEEIFDCDIYDVYTKYTPQEALAKLEAYEREQNEVKVGDVIEATDFCGDVFKGTVLDFKDGAETEVFVLDENGCVDVWKIADCKKTGKHIEINNILEQIRGD